MRETQTTRLSWGRELDGKAVTLLAEPEGIKVSAAHPEALGEKALAALTGGTPLEVAGSADGLSATRRALVARSDSMAWRSCAQSFLSPLSDARQATLLAPDTPVGDGQNWRVGEVWRIAAFTKGRSADAIVRFTGDPEAPMAILDIQRGAAQAPDAVYCLGLALEGSEK